MQVFRFYSRQRPHPLGSHYYAYIRCNWPWEVWAINRRIKQDASHIRPAKGPGPQAYGAQFMMSLKHPRPWSALGI